MVYGKTTIMKILQNLLNFNFKELIKYDFESINIEVSTKNAKILKDTIKYTDLLPTDEEIKEYIKNSDYFRRDFLSEWGFYRDEVTDEEKIECFSDDDSMTDEEKIDCWDFNMEEIEFEEGHFVVLTNELLNDLIKRKELKNIIRKIIKKEKFSDLYYKNYIDGLNNYDIDSNSYLFEAEFNYNSMFSYIGTYDYGRVKDTLENIIELIKEFIEKILASKNDISFINKKNITRMLSIIKDNIDKFIDILDMTKVYKFENELLTSSLITNELLDWKAVAPCKYCDFFKDIEQKIYEEVLNQIDGRDFENNIFDRIDKDYILKNQSKDILELNNSTIEINSIINHYFYDEKFVATINSLALACYVIAHNPDWKLTTEKEAKTDKIQIKDRFIKYIRPVLLRNCPFDVDWGSILDRTTNEIFSDFYTKEWYLFEENINPKMKILQELLNKYMMNKDVEVTPMGLLIKSKDGNQNIPINSLSSGEKKLIVIFMHCLFNEDVPIIIDEPEISLSIIWQENLLPDLLEKTKIKQVIVATHSSAIISNSILDKYIIPLPNSLVDKGGNSNE